MNFPKAKNESDNFGRVPYEDADWFGYSTLTPETPPTVTTITVPTTAAAAAATTATVPATHAFG